MRSDQRFWAALAGVAGLTAAAFVTAAWVATGASRGSAQLGILLVGGSSLLALELKRRALARRSLPGVLGVVVGLFALRVGLVLGGASWARAHHLPQTAYVVGFFAMYILLQWVEIGFVVAEAKPPGRGGI